MCEINELFFLATQISFLAFNVWQHIFRIFDDKNEHYKLPAIIYHIPMLKKFSYL